LLTSPVRLIDGMAQVPQGPGLGVELDTEVMDRFLWRG
jgi:L-alanine-DL-glutamate epimerase-like enolase superfamily enzyme